VAAGFTQIVTRQCFSYAGYSPAQIAVGKNRREKERMKDEGLS
jgi:hypothetical protein